MNTVELMEHISEDVQKHLSDMLTEEYYSLRRSMVIEYIMQTD